VARGNEVEQVVLISDAYTRWQAAHVIGFLAILARSQRLSSATFTETTTTVIEMNDGNGQARG
jgi:negative regulator of replication initiation